MISPFTDGRPLFAVLDRQSAWGAFLAARLLAAQCVGGTAVAIRHMDALEALDSCLVDNQTPVGIMLAEDFDELRYLVSFVTRHTRRPGTMLIVASHAGNAETEWLLRECGAHVVVHRMEEVISLEGPLRRFFQRSTA